MKKSHDTSSAVTSRARKIIHTCGVELTSVFEHAHIIDKEDSNTFWRHATEKETRNVGIVFEILEEVKHTLNNYKQEIVHIIFDEKMDFTKKDR